MQRNLGKKSPRRPGEPNTVHLPAHGEGGGRKGNGGSPVLGTARGKRSPARQVIHLRHAERLARIRYHAGLSDLEDFGQAAQPSLPRLRRQRLLPSCGTGRNCQRVETSGPPARSERQEVLRSCPLAPQTDWQREGAALPSGAHPTRNCFRWGEFRPDFCRSLWPLIEAAEPPFNLALEPCCDRNKSLVGNHIVLQPTRHARRPDVEKSSSRVGATECTDDFLSGFRHRPIVSHD